jgi:A/G-specific adenine glycosylase
MSAKRFPKQNTLVIDLLNWYDHNARVLPWRVGPGKRLDGARPNPYHVWLSEVMLQQTTVAAVIGYFNNFIEKWPDITALAGADEEEILKAWAGLGYYSRARNLKKCADRVVGQFGGCFPNDDVSLRSLPGIGDYTAAAIGAIAFQRAEPVVDGNIERIISRLETIEIPLPKSRPLVRQRMGALVPSERPGDFVQAMMDLGAGICAPRNPSCDECPIGNHCKAGASDNPQNWPLRLAKKPKPERVGAAFVTIDGDGAVLLQKRGEKGLLAGMSQVPTSGWTAKEDGESGADAAPFAADWQACGTIRHTFTHFHLTLHVYQAKVDGEITSNGWWSKDVVNEALPTVFKKVISKAEMANSCIFK